MAFDRYVGLGKEATAGVAVPATAFLPDAGVSVERGQQFYEREANLQGLVGMPAIALHYLPRVNVSGVELNAYESAKLFYYALGGVSSNLLGSVAYEHILTPAVDLPSATIEVKSDVEGKSLQVAGCYLNELSVKVEAGSAALIDVGFVGMTLDDNATLASSPSYSAKVLTGVSAVLKIDDTEVAVQSAEVNLNNNLEQRVPINATNPASIKRAGLIGIDGSIAFDGFPMAEYNKFKSGTPARVELILTGSEIESGINEEIKITIYSAVYTGGFAFEFNNEVMSGEAEFQGFTDVVSGKSIEIRVVNDYTNAEFIA